MNRMQIELYKRKKFKRKILLMNKYEDKTIILEEKKELLKLLR
jgi:hypothetical protein